MCHLLHWHPLSHLGRGRGSILDCRRAFPNRCSWSLKSFGHLILDTLLGIQELPLLIRVVILRGAFVCFLLYLLPGSSLLLSQPALPSCGHPHLCIQLALPRLLWHATLSLVHRLAQPGWLLLCHPVGSIPLCLVALLAGLPWLFQLMWSIQHILARLFANLVGLLWLLQPRHAAVLIFHLLQCGLRLYLTDSSSRWLALALQFSLLKFSRSHATTVARQVRSPSCFGSARHQLHRDHYSSSVLSNSD